MARNIGKWLGTKYDSQFESENTNVDRLSKWTGVSPQSVTEAQPLPTNFQFEDYNRLLGERGRIDPVYGDIDEQRAQAQSGAEKLGMMLPRIATKVATEVAKIPGSVYGLGEWATTGFDIDEFENSINNAWTKGVDEAAQTFNEEVLPVYKRREIEEGGFFKQITSPEFWATEGADGIGFLVSMMAPGAALRGLGAGQAIMKGLTKVPGVTRFGSAGKLTKAGLKAADTVNDWTSAGVNTIIEATAEGVENMKAAEKALFDKKLNELISTGQYDPQQASDLATEYINDPEIRKKISEGGFNTFKWNLGILLGPNILDQKWIFKGANALEAKGVIGKRMGNVVGKTSDDALSSIQRLTPKQVLGEVGKVGAVGVAKEGFFEEGFQYAASELEKEKIVNPDEATNILATYLDALSDTDMQKSIFLGSVLGGGMGMINGYKVAKREDEYLFGREASEASKLGKKLGFKDTEASKGVLQVFKDNFVKRYQSVNDLYKTDEKGNLVLDENGQSILDPVKVTQYGTSLLKDVEEKELLQDYIDRGDKEGYEYIKSIRDFKYMMPFMQEDGGHELLIQHIGNLANKEVEELAATGMYDKMPVEEVKKDLLNKANEIKNIVDKADKNIVPLYQTKDTNKEYAKTFNDVLYDSYVSSEYKKNFINKRKNALNININNLSSIPTNSEKTTVEKLVPGDLININGVKQQVVQHREGNLKTINLNGELTSTEDTSLKDIPVEKYTDINPIDRKQLVDNLVASYKYNNDLKNLVVNQEKLFTPEGQQKAFDEYTSKFKKLENDTQEDVIQAEVDTFSSKINEAKEEELGAIADEIVNSTTIKEGSKKKLLDFLRIKRAEYEKKKAEQILKEKEEVIPAPKESVVEEKLTPEQQMQQELDVIRNSIREQFGITSEEEVEEILTDSSAAQAILQKYGAISTKPIVEEIVPETTLESNAKVIVNTNQEQPVIKDEDGEEVEQNEPTRQTTKKVKELETNQNTVNKTLDKKTTITNLAYLTVEHKDRKSITQDGNLLFVEGADHRTSIPGYYEGGDEIVMFVDTTSEEYEANKNNPDFIPIAVQLKSDFDSGNKTIKTWLHKLDWINEENVAADFVEQVKEETKALRKFIFENPGTYVNVITSKSPGSLNRSRRERTVKDVIGNDARPIITFGSTTQTLKTIPANADVLNYDRVVAGIPYLVLPMANNQWIATWLRQRELGEKNSMGDFTNPIYGKYINNIQAIMEAFSKGELTGVTTEQELRKELDKYFYVNRKRISEDTDLSKNLLFHVQDLGEGVVQIQLISHDRKGKGFRDYRCRNGVWYRVEGKNVEKKLTSTQMANYLKEKLSDKYPNIVESATKEPQSFSVFELQGDKLVKVNKNYIDFLSENKVVTSRIEGLDVTDDNGKVTRTYASQSNIGINTDVNNLTPLNTVSTSSIEEKDTKKDISGDKNLDNSEIIPNFDELFNQLVKEKETLQDKNDEGERIKNFCNGKIGKGNLIDRNNI